MIKGEIKNKVADSGIININLSIYAPKETILELDIKQFLFNGLVLKEKEFRLALKEFDFKKYENKIVGVFCGASVIIPMWAYMLITTYLNNMDAKIYFGNKNEVLQLIIKKNINCIDVKDFKEKRVIVNGCSNIKLSEGLYIAITKKLQKNVKSLMFGEACSAVPIFKNK
tara:strand:- start:708 stop:1217 length:510 start_codon:yes stop_codon:yes gene_type:complete